MKSKSTAFLMILFLLFSFTLSFNSNAEAVTKKGLNIQLNSLQTSFDEHLKNYGNDIGDVQKKIEEANSQIGTLQKKLDHANAKIATLEEKISELKAQAEPEEVTAPAETAAPSE